MPNERRIIVIAKFREFDAEAWRRLIVAYTYALHDRRKQAADGDESAERKHIGDVHKEGTA